MKLVRRSLREGVRHSVVSLLPEGPLAAPLREMGVEILFLGMRSGRADPRGLIALCSILRRLRPSVIQAWMYHGNLLGGIAGKLSGIPSVWGIHHGRLSGEETGRITLRTARLCARLSPFLPEAIVCCSPSALRAHLEMGYDEKKMTVIPNGFDLEAFRPDPEARAASRRRLGFSRGEFVIGMAARFVPEKDHGTFFAAAGLFASRHPEARFVLCGEGISPGSPGMARLLDAHPLLRDRTVLLGRVEDMAGLYPAFDAAALPSRNEAFPNVLGEALACGVPCVGSHAGDAAAIVGDGGIVIPPGDPGALDAGWETIFSLSPEKRREMGERGRQGVMERFSISGAEKRYREVWMRASGTEGEGTPSSSR